MEDPFNCFMCTNLDVLEINNFMLKKIDQKVVFGHNYEINYFVNIFFKNLNFHKIIFLKLIRSKLFLKCF